MKTIEVPIDTLKELAHCYQKTHGHTANTYVATEMLINGAESLPANRELPRWMAYKLASEGKIVSVDGVDEEYTFHDGAFCYRRKGRREWLPPSCSDLPFYSAEKRTGWRIVRPEPPKMDFLTAAEKRWKTFRGEIACSDADSLTRPALISRMDELEQEQP